MKRLLLTISCGAFLVACPNPADEAQKAQVGEKKAAVEKTEEKKPAPAKKADAMALAVDVSKSTIGFVGSKVTGNHEGAFEKFEGTIHYVEGIVGSRAAITIDMSSVTTDAEKLTGHLKSPDFFDVAKHPTAKFRLEEITAVDNDRYKVSGELDLHGVTKAIAFEATITADEDAVRAKSEFAINRKDFGIVYAGKPDDLIRDDVLIKLDITAPRT